MSAEEGDPKDSNASGAPVPAREHPLPEQSVLEGVLELEVLANESAYLAQHQNAVRTVRSLVLHNRSEFPVEAVQIALGTSGGQARTKSLRLDRLAPRASHTFRQLDLDFEPEALRRRTERERTELVIEVLGRLARPIDTTTAEHDTTQPTVAASHRQPLDILAWNEWPGLKDLPELLAAFVTPNAPEVAALFPRIAQGLLQSTGRDSLDGYQSQDKERVRRMVAAVYASAAELGLGYIMTAASFERTGQKVRLPELLLRERFGNCLDLTVFLAAVCEQIGLHPLLILVEGHILLGVWTHESSFAGPVHEVASAILNRVPLGDIVLVESTGLTSTRPAAFAAACEMAAATLDAKADSMVAIDVRRAREAKIRPLSLERKDALPPDPANELPRGLPDAGELAPVQTPLPAGGASAAKDRVERWKARLLDLSLANRLIKFRETKRTLPLAVDPEDLFNALQSEAAFRLKSALELWPEHGDRDQDLLQGKAPKHDLRERSRAPLARRWIPTALATDELERRLTGLYRDARTFEQESGSSNLFIAFGMLQWFEAQSSSTAHKAPLFLLPVQLVRPRSQAIQLSAREGELKVNVTLLHKLRADLDLDLLDLEPLFAAESDVDLPRLFATFRDRIKDEPRFEVREEAHLSMFPFAKFVLWRDLHQHMALLSESPVVRLLREGQSEPEKDPLPRAHELDDLCPPGTLACPLDADSSQLTAVVAASRGRTFVLQGPPGTGKSQTIANMIAQALDQGQRVLFVAEKAAALDVVHQRLQAIGLGKACLALHAHKADKKEVLAQLGAALNAEHGPEIRGHADTVRELRQRQDELNRYVRALHLRHPCGASLFDLVGRATQLGTGPMIAPPPHLGLGSSPESLSSAEEAIGRLAQAARAAGYRPDHPLAALAVRSWSPSIEAHLRGALERAIQAHQALSACRQEPGLPWRLSAGDSELSATDLDLEARCLEHLLGCPGTTLAQLQRANHRDLNQKLAREVELTAALQSAQAAADRTWRADFQRGDPNLWLARIASVKKSPWIVRIFLRPRLMAELEVHRVAQSSATGLTEIELDLNSLAELQALRREFETLAVALEGAFASPSEAGIDVARCQAELRWSRVAVDLLDQLGAKDKAAATAFHDTALNLHPESSGQGHALLTQALAAHLAWALAVQALDQAGAKPALIAPAPHGFAGRLIILQSILAHLSGLRAWVGWHAAVGDAMALGLAPVLETLRQGQLAAPEWKMAWQRGLTAALAEAAFQADRALERFDRATHEERLERFRELDRALLQTTAELAKRRIEERALLANHNPRDPEATLLRKELAKKARHLAVRTLFQRTPKLLGELKPCLLMSPLAVAQHLQPDFKADLVIFDEASQIPVPDAISALGRGRAAVVVGDSKQMPPTSFFQKIEVPEDSQSDEELLQTPEDMESILDECLTAGLEEFHLRWHYRSQHESLIAFSNHHYYNDRLFTFPSAIDAAPGLGVHHVFVQDGIYERGRSRTNRREAEQIVAEVQRRCALADRDDPPSIGIVAFSLTQATLIEDLLEAARMKDEALERALSAEREPLFVKNLENVQGDERDAIFFSICYGRDAAGKLNMAFGPIQLAGGERRLNVAITRARRELIVYSSILPGDIDLRRTRSLGVEHLKGFLDYAVRGPIALPGAITFEGGATESPFEQAVAEALKARGHDIATQVGCSGYRIDLAVRDPAQPGRFLLGIECDGRTYHSAASARDRDRLRQAVLERLGWTLHRVWSTDWWHQPMAEIERIEATLAALTSTALQAPRSPAPEASLGQDVPAIAAPLPDRIESLGRTIEAQPKAPELNAHDDSAAAPSADPDLHAESDSLSRDEATIEDAIPVASLNIDASAGEAPLPAPLFSTAEHAEARALLEDLLATESEPWDPKDILRPYQLTVAAIDRELFEPERVPELSLSLQEIVRIEGPITNALLLRRACEQAGIQRRGSRISQSLHIATARMVREGTPSIHGTFWPSNVPMATWRFVRHPTHDHRSIRDLADIPLHELGNALWFELQRERNPDPDQLFRAVLRLFGFNNLGSRLRDTLALALQHLIERRRPS